MLVLRAVGRGNSLFLLLFYHINYTAYTATDNKIKTADESGKCFMNQRSEYFPNMNELQTNITVKKSDVMRVMLEDVLSGIIGMS